MAGFFQKIIPFLGGSAFSKKGKSLLGGTPEKFEQRQLLGKEQLPLYNQLVNAGLTPGAGGAFGTSADYYRNLLSDNPEDLNAYAAPETRRFNEEILPSLSEQFAGMGSGNLSSSGFRNAAVNAGADLQERIAAIRAQLRQQGAAGLANIGQAGLGNFYGNMFRPGTPGLLEQAAPAIGTALGSFAGPFGAAAGNAAGNWLSSSLKGRTSPYGNAAVNPAMISGRFIG